MTMNKIEIGQKWKKKNLPFIVKVVEIKEEQIVLSVLKERTGGLKTGPVLLRLDKEVLIARYHLLESSENKS